VLDINPDWPEALCNLGIALTRLGGEQSLKTALTCFDLALSLAPEFALAHNNLGAALEKSNRADEALIAYRSAMRSEPRYIESHLNFAALLLRLGRTNDAIARYRIVLDLDAKNVAARQALISLSDLMQADGRDADAAATCAIVTRRIPREAEALVKLAFT
jgi:protein O-GlcNAc transferase